MIITLVSRLARAVMAVRARFPRFRWYKGEHRADSAAGYDWTPPTPRPALPPLPPAPPRVPRYVITLSDIVRDLYAAAEDEMTARIQAAVAQSRADWLMPHA